METHPPVHHSQKDQRTGSLQPSVPPIGLLVSLQGGFSYEKKNICRGKLSVKRLLVKGPGKSLPCLKRSGEANKVLLTPP
jgi:hypothetical protein